jgi:hypothetical protein
MNIGFTGTQKGCTDKQIKCLQSIFQFFQTDVKCTGIKSFHVGGCIGADEDATKALMLVNCFGHNTFFILHPPLNESKVNEFHNSDLYAWRFEPKDYLERNHAIVDSVTHMIACPAERNEIQRSGTWATVRYARKRNILTMMVYPDGMMEYQRGDKIYYTDQFSDMKAN